MIRGWEGGANGNGNDTATVNGQLNAIAHGHGNGDSAGYREGYAEGDPDRDVDMNDRCVRGNNEEEEDGDIKPRGWDGMRVGGVAPGDGIVYESRRTS
jgi:hypothetical protein